MSQLTEYEKEKHQKLCEEKEISWFDTKPKETAALNRLITKGYAVFDIARRMWLPATPGGE